MYPRHCRQGLLQDPIPRNLYLLFLISLCLLVPCASVTRAEPPPDPTPVIRHITVRGNTRTHTGVIRRELLFASGDHLDSILVSETARNLRRLFFLGRVDIQVRENGGNADILIEVEDLYSRALSPLLSGEAGELSYGLVALDYNFLGRGQEVQLTVEHDAISGNSASAYYRMPRLLDSRHDLTGRLDVGQEGHDVRLAFSRPFYALSARWAYGASTFTQKQVHRLYTDQVLSDRYTQQVDGGALWLTRSFGNLIKYRPNVHLSLTDRRFAPDPGYTYAPQNRRRVLPSLGFTVWRPRYEKTRFIHALGRTEDLQTGSWLSLRLGLSHRGLGSDQNFRTLQAQLSPRFKPYDDGYAFLTLFLSARHRHSGYFNLFALAELLVYAHLKEIHTLALRLRWDALSRPEDASQLLLGVDRGLRGYAPRRFDGARRFLLNLEARPTLYRHPAFVLGGAFFVDGGTAWTPGRTPSSLNLASGIGARLGLTRVYNNPILRADLSYALQDRAWQISVGMGQYF